PPMPNTPYPVAAGFSRGEKALLPPFLVEHLRDALKQSGIELDDRARQALNDFAAWFSVNFNLWKGSTIILLVLGSGPIPTFAPAYVPVGPVVGGSIRAERGFLIGPPFGG